MKFTSRAGRIGAPAWLSIAAAAAIALSGCGSDSGSSSSSSSTKSSGGSAGGGADVSAAQTAVKNAEQKPAKILQTKPLAKKPEAGKTMVFIKCELSQCADIASGVKGGTEALGWTYKELTFKSSDPATLVTSMKQALQFKPVAVSFSGIPQAVWKGVIPSFQSAGVKIVPIVTGPLETPSDTVPVTVGDFTSMGEALGNYVIAQSQGKGHALLVDVPAFPILTGYVTGAKKALDGCSGCKTAAFNGTLAQITGGTFVSGIVTALKKDPSIKYIISSDYVFHPNLPAALKAAQIDGVTITGGQPEPANLKEIQGGNGGAAALYNNVLTGWVAMDAVAHLAEGDTVTQDDVGVPGQLLTKDNITGTDLNSYAVPDGYQDAFKKLWLVG
jgi:ribose transport system substrate-binding protein